MESTERIYAIGASLSAGVLLAFLILLNSALGIRIGVLESSFMAHLTGGLLAFIIVVGRMGKSGIKNITAVPRYLLIGGALGIVVTAIGNLAAPVIGLLLLLSILTTFELIGSAVADHFGLFGLPQFRINFNRSVGLVLAVLGVILIMWG